MYRVLQLSTVHKSSDVRVYGKMTLSLLDNGYEVHLMAIDSKSELDKRLYFYPLTNSLSIFIFNKIINNLRALKLILYLRPRIIHFHDPELLLIAIFLRIFGFNFVYDIHEDVPRDVQHKKISLVVKRILFFCLERFENSAARFLGNVIVVTPSLYVRFKENVRNIALVRNFPSTVQKNGLYYDANKISYIVYSGTISENRGIFELLDVLLMFNGKVRLYLVGELHSAELYSKVVKHKGWAYVDYKGLVSQKEVYDYYRQSLIGMVTLHNIDTYRDSYPLKLFEYINAGLPVVISNFSNWKDLFGSQCVGVFVDPSDSKAIYKGLVDIFSSYSSYKKKVSELSGFYSWSTERSVLLDFYKRIL